MNREEIRLKCVEIVMPTAAKSGLTTGEIFSVAEAAYKFVVETTGEEAKGQAKAPKAK